MKGRRIYIRSVVRLIPYKSPFLSWSWEMRIESWNGMSPLSATLSSSYFAALGALAVYPRFPAFHSTDKHIGRHSDDWLFGGWDVMKLFGGRKDKRQGKGKEREEEVIEGGVEGDDTS